MKEPLGPVAFRQPTSQETMLEDPLGALATVFARELELDVLLLAEESGTRLKPLRVWNSGAVADLVSVLSKLNTTEIAKRCTMAQGQYLRATVLPSAAQWISEEFAAHAIRPTVPSGLGKTVYQIAYSRTPRETTPGRHPKTRLTTEKCRILAAFADMHVLTADGSIHLSKEPTDRDKIRQLLTDIAYAKTNINVEVLISVAYASVQTRRALPALTNMAPATTTLARRVVGLSVLFSVGLSAISGAAYVASQNGFSFGGLTSSKMGSLTILAAGFSIECLIGACWLSTLLNMNRGERGNDE